MGNKVVPIKTRQIFSFASTALIVFVDKEIFQTLCLLAFDEWKITIKPNTIIMFGTYFAPQFWH